MVKDIAAEKVRRHREPSTSCGRFQWRKKAILAGKDDEGIKRQHLANKSIAIICKSQLDSKACV